MIVRLLMRVRPAAVAIAVTAALLGACSSYGTLPTAPLNAEEKTPPYLIGPGDGLTIFVWRNPEVSTSVPVRPDGRISVPLIEDLEAAGKTPTQLARDIEKQLGVYIQDPLVTVMVTSLPATSPSRYGWWGRPSSPRRFPIGPTCPCSTC